MKKGRVHLVALVPWWKHNDMGVIEAEDFCGILRWSKVCVDKKSDIELVKNPVFHSCSKRIKIWCHYIRKCVENSEVGLRHVGTEEHRADIFTKSLGKVKFFAFRSLFGLEDVKEQLRAYGGDCWKLPQKEALDKTPLSLFFHFVLFFFLFRHDPIKLISYFLWRVLEYGD